MGRLSPARFVDAALEATVVGSFTRFGPAVRRRLFDWDELPRLDGDVVVVTGATSGLGRATAVALGVLGATVEVVGRNAERGAEVVDEVERAGSAATLRLADIADLTATRRLAKALSDEHDTIRTIVHNAGVMMEERTTTDTGLEATWATMVVAPHLLTRLLADRTERAVWVSSGGMYTQRVELDDLDWGRREWSGPKAYAQAKRAQVDLVREATARGEPPLQVAMHPGWAGTPGVEASLPAFSKVMAPLLRTPEVGADTIVWAAAVGEAELEPGAFYLDRRPRGTVRWPGTRTSDADRIRLRTIVDEQAGLATV